MTRDHGKRLDSELAPLVTATVHPSAVLRASGGEARTEAMAALVSDLTRVARHLAGGPLRG